MDFSELPLPLFFQEHYHKFPSLTPIQEKALQAGLLQGTSLLACAPTASGKTMIATMALCQQVGKGKVIYLVPLKALASEKYKEYQKLLEKTKYKVVISTGDLDSENDFLTKYDVLILTTEKLDSLLRHRVSWLGEVKVVIVDEIHLLNDPHRGPTLEVVLTLLQKLIHPQLIGLSATIGNPKELAQWLKATLIQDSWRPVELKKGIHCQGKTEFF